MNFTSRIGFAAFTVFAFAQACATRTEESSSSDDQNVTSSSSSDCASVLRDYAAAHEHDATPVKLVTEGAFEPYNFRDVDGAGNPGGPVKGWEVDYAGKVMAKIGRVFTIEARAWEKGCCDRDPANALRGLPPSGPESLWTETYKGSFDMFFGFVSNGEVRLTVMPFSDRYGFMPAAQSFVYPKATLPNGVSALSDLARKKIAVQQGTNPDFYLQYILNAEAHLGIDIKTFATLEEAASALSSGAVDMLMGNSYETGVSDLVATGNFGSDTNIFTIDPKGLNRIWGTGAAFGMTPAIENGAPKRDAQGFAVPKDPALLKAVNCAIKQLASEVYDELNTKWTPAKTAYCPPTDSEEQCAARPM